MTGPELGTHVVAGRPVRMPVEIRRASACAGHFPLPLDSAARVLEPIGLVPAPVAPGRGLAVLGFVRYDDGDLGPYNEFLVALLARRPDRPRAVGAYIDWLPVDQSFTLAAGQSIWGFPKELADFNVTWARPEIGCAVRIGGQRVVEFRVSNGIPVPAGLSRIAVDAYTHRHGRTARVPWSVSCAGVRIRPGGGRVDWGDHPLADRFRAWGLNPKPVLTTRIAQLTMVFHDAETVHRVPETSTTANASESRR